MTRCAGCLIGLRWKIFRSFSLWSWVRHPRLTYSMWKAHYHFTLAFGDEKELFRRFCENLAAELVKRWNELNKGELS